MPQAFVQNGQQLYNLDKSLLTKLDGKRYALDKWTIKDIFQLLKIIEEKYYPLV